MKFSSETRAERHDKTDIFSVDSLQTELRDTLELTRNSEETVAGY